MHRELRVVIRRRAEAQIASAHDWYERQREGLGQDLLQNVREAIDHLRTSAEMYAFVYRDFRRVAIRRFPYGIYYRVVEDRVIVHRVLHNRQSLSNLD